MRQLLIVISSVFFSLSLYAHEYYFAFAELELNPFTSRLEGTVMLTKHDFERALNSLGIAVNDLSEELSDSTLQTEVEHYLNQHLTFNTENYHSAFELEGFESFLNGQLYLYLSSEAPVNPGQFSVHFDLLMETYPDQQNKITLYYKERSYTKAFIKSEETQEINLEME